MEIIGTIIACFIMFGWFPYTGYCLGKSLKYLLLGDKVAPKKARRAGKVGLNASDVKTRVPKSSKGSYPVISSYGEEHKITNPVDFPT
mgnify:CR=1 FL=1